MISNDLDTTLLYMNSLVQGYFEDIHYQVLTVLVARKS